MTLAVEAPTPTQPTAPHTVPIVVLGADALLAASPATPVQLAHACLRAGFSNVVPATWGDEILAAGVLRRLPNFGNGPVIQCSCPIVAHRLLTVGGDLRPVMLGLVPPPVAIARYIRTLSRPTHTRITYVGGCPGAVDESIDVRMTPEALIAMLAERDIALDDQPRIFESVIPPDRRRFRSQPGGIPAADVLWTESGSRTLVEIDGDDFVADIAQHLLAGKNILIDASARLGCVCSGAVAGSPPKQARPSVIALEPPRATIPVVDEQAPIELDLPIPAAPRAPIDVVALPAGPAQPTNPPARGFDTALGHRISPVRGFAAIPEASQSRPSGPSTAASRPIAGSVPIARDAAGRSLPRAYVARRRSSPRGTPIIPEQAKDSFARATTPNMARDPFDDTPDDSLDFEIEMDHAAPEQLAQRLRFRYMLLILLAIAVTIVVSSTIAIVAGRALNRPPAPVSAPATTPSAR